MLDAIAFFTGASLSAMLGVLQFRVDRGTGRVSGYLLLWVVGFAWTFGNFLRCTLDLAGVSADSASARFAETLAWSCTLLGPLSIGKLLQSSLGSASRAARGFVALSYGVSLLNLGLMVRAIELHDWQLEAGGYPTVSFFIGTGFGALALVLYLLHRHRAPEPERRSMPRWFAPVALLFAAVHTGCILVSMLFPGMPDGLMTATTLIGRHWTIPWSVLIAVSLAQAHYADVVLKRSLWLIASVTLSTWISLQIIGTAPGLRALASVLSISALMMATPFLIRALEALVDKAILHRPDYPEAGRKLDDAFRRAADPGQLIDAALHSLRSTLHVDAHWVESTRRMEIAAHRSRTLMQPELAFLQSVRTHLDHRLEAQRFETEQRALLLREERLKRLLTEAELKALRTQVDPHFLFNTLNTIVELIGSNPQQAERMTERLAECFRYALAKHSRDLSTLDEELDFARQYLEIEQVRFGDRLRVQLSRGDATGSESIPSLLLQPLLENAIRHGLAPVREGGYVRVQAHREGERLHLSIEDDGVGLRTGSSDGVGLRNVQERLRTLYAQAAQFLIGARAGGRGTTVTIVIPLTIPPLAPLHAH